MANDLDIQLGEVEEAEPEVRLRPDDNKHFGVAPVFSPSKNELPIFVDLDAMIDMEDHALDDTSVELGGVMLGGQAGVADHINVGAGAQIAAQGGVICDVPAGESWGGTPAMPHREWLRAAVWAARQSKRKADDK